MMRSHCPRAKKFDVPLFESCFLNRNLKTPDGDVSIYFLLFFKISARYYYYYKKKLMANSSVDHF